MIAMSKKLYAAFIPLLAVALAVLPATASATTVTPAGASAEIEGKSANQTFTANNGTGVVVSCKKVTGKFTVPASPKNSVAEGSVTTDFTTQPTYSECSNSMGGTTNVTTNITNGKWAVDTEDFPDTEPIGDVARGDAFAIGLPKAGAKIEIVNACTITVSPTEASAIIGSWHDGTKPTGAEASWGRIKEQINFEGCSVVGAEPPGIYAGEVWVKNVTAGATAAIKF
jgi:hypothetical protein